MFIKIDLSNERENIKKMNYYLDINLYELADIRERLIQKYNKGVITSEEILKLNIIDEQVDEIIKQRSKI